MKSLKDQIIEINESIAISHAELMRATNEYVVKHQLANLAHEALVLRSGRLEDLKQELRELVIKEACL